jgi:hypothetical protein
MLESADITSSLSRQSCYPNADLSPSLYLRPNRSEDLVHLDLTSPRVAETHRHLPHELTRLIYGASNLASYLKQYPRKEWRQSVACSMLALGIFCGRHLTESQVQSLSDVANFAWEVDTLDLICGQVNPTSDPGDLRAASRDYWHQVNSKFISQNWTHQTDQLCSSNGGDSLTDWYDRQTVLDWWSCLANHGLAQQEFTQISQSQTHASRHGLDCHRREILGKILHYQDHFESSDSLPASVDPQTLTYRFLTAKWFTDGWLEGADYHLPNWLHQRVANLVFAQQAFDDLATVTEDLKLGLSNLFVHPSQSTDIKQPTSTFEFQPKPTLSRLTYYVVDQLEVGRGVDSLGNQAKQWLLEQGLRLGARWGAPRLTRHAGCEDPQTVSPRAYLGV